MNEEEAEGHEQESLSADVIDLHTQKTEVRRLAQFMLNIASPDRAAGRQATAT